MQRQPTISPRNQTKNDCLIYSIANVFMRKIVILLKWTTEDSSIDWDEVDPNTCDIYVHGSENGNPIKYKYCILYAYVQGILRKSFGSCGAFAEPTTEAFCNIFNEIMRSDITTESILTHILRDNEIQILKEQNSIYLRELKNKSLTREGLTDEEKEQFEECKTAEKELNFDFNPIYKPILVSTLQGIKDALQGKEFDALTILFYDKKTNMTIENSDPNFKKLTKEFNDGFYGIMHIELSNDLFNFFQRIHINDTENYNIIINSIKEKSAQKYQIQKEIEQKEIEIDQMQKKRKIEPLNTILEELKHKLSTLESELTYLLERYLELPTGISGKDPDNGEIYELKLSDTFNYMEDTIKTHSIDPKNNDVLDSRGNIVAADGHAVVAKNIFEIGPKKVVLAKNHWGKDWGSEGEMLFEPNKRVYRASISIIILREQNSPLIKTPFLGGKQSRKKTYRKLKKKSKKSKKSRKSKRTKGYKRK
jgi:hypothetical protein